MELGFIGTGVMGQSMVGHLLAAGHQVSVYNRTKSKTDGLIEKGAKWADNPSEVAANSEVVFTMVGYPSDVEEVYYGDKGIFQTDVTGKVLVDFTTSTPDLAERIFQTASENGAASMDAPVSGGDLGAQNATLTIMAGGDQATYEKVLPLFKIMGKSYQLQGGPGKGQHTKMANQIMIAGTMTGLTEMLVYAQAAGLDLPQVIQTLSGGGANNWSMTNYSPRILKEDYSPGFFVKHFITDLGIAKSLYDQLANKGYENDGTQALIKLWWQDGKKS